MAKIEDIARRRKESPHVIKKTSSNIITEASYGTLYKVREEIYNYIERPSVNVAYRGKIGLISPL